MAVEKKTDLIGGRGSVPPTTYVQRLNPDTNAMEAVGATQYVWVKNVPGSDIVILEDVVAACNTAAEVGNPALNSNLEIKEVTGVGKGVDANGGKALVKVVWGRKDFAWPVGYQALTPRAWGVPGFAKVKRYIRNDNGTFKLCNSTGQQVMMQGQNRPASEIIDWPNRKLFYRERITGSVELGLRDADEGKFNGGSWEGFAANTVRFLGHTIKTYTGSSGTIVNDRVWMWEHRPNRVEGGITDSGWNVHSLKGDNTVAVVSMVAMWGTASGPFPNI